MKTIIVYFSHSHNNKLLASYLKNRLSVDIFRIEEENKRTWLKILLDVLFNRTPQIRDYYHPLFLYDNYVFVAPVWSGKIASPLKTFLHKEKDAIGRYSFIILCAAVNGQHSKIVRELTRLVGHPPVIVTELRVDNVFPAEKGEKIRYTAGYQLEEQDLLLFSKEIDSFVEAVSNAVSV